MRYKAIYNQLPVWKQFDPLIPILPYLLGVLWGIDENHALKTFGTPAGTRTYISAWQTTTVIVTIWEEFIVLGYRTCLWDPQASQGEFLGLWHSVHPSASGEAVCMTEQQRPMLPSCLEGSFKVSGPQSCLWALPAWKSHRTMKRYIKVLPAELEWEISCPEALLPSFPSQEGHTPCLPINRSFESHGNSNSQTWWITLMSHRSSGSPLVAQKQPFPISCRLKKD